MSKLVSVCIATYNGEKYIKEQLDSILNQTYHNIEIIIQDDASTDNTIDIIKNYKNQKIQLFQNPNNLGYIKNFETLIQRANGDYIALCDQDDIWVESKIEKLLQNIHSFSLIYSNSLLIDKEAKSLNRTLSQHLKNNFITSHHPLNFLYDNSVSAHSILFKKELKPYLVNFPTQLYFDQYIAMVGASQKGIHYINKPLVHYRQHETNTLKKIATKKSLLQKIKTKLDKKNNINLQEQLKFKELLEKEIFNQQTKDILSTLLTNSKNFNHKFFNLELFLFYMKHKHILFSITQKNPTLLSFKKSIGYKLYKVLPIL